MVVQSLESLLPAFERTLAADFLRLIDGDPDGFQVVLTEVFKQAAPDLRDINELAATMARERAAALVVGANENQREVIRRIVRRGLDNGWSDVEIQDRLKEKVGLHPRYADAVENYRSGLIDKGVKRGIANRMAREYARRLKAQRALVIARTEVQKALNDAQRALWQEQQELGEVSPYAVRIYRVHKDERLCRICKPLNGKRSSLGKEGGYNIPKIGRVVGPPVHPNCRCWEILEDQGVRKSYLRPRLLPQDQTDVRLGDPKLSSEFVLRDRLRGVAKADRTDISGRELPRPSLGRHVEHVGRMVPPEQVGDLAARRRVAGVANLDTFGDRAMVALPDDSMGTVEPTDWHPDDAVATSVLGTVEEQASVRKDGRAGEHLVVGGSTVTSHGAKNNESSARKARLSTAFKHRRLVEPGENEAKS